MSAFLPGIMEELHSSFFFLVGLLFCYIPRMWRMKYIRMKRVCALDFLKLESRKNKERGAIDL